MPRKNQRWVNHVSPDPTVYLKTEALLERLHLHTVCESAQCPNRGTCFAEGTATFLLLGTTCTRNCSFCAVDHGPPLPPDEDEPDRICRAVAAMKIRHVVLTSVTRDDLPDGGASQFVKTVRSLKAGNSGITIEVLIPDFGGSEEALRSVLNELPEVLNHNLETVPRLYPRIRPQADYQRSLRLLQKVKELQPRCLTKSGLMAGIGEEPDEIRAVMEDLRAVGCDLLTIGQYLRPSFNHYPLIRRLRAEEFDAYREVGEKMGFSAVFSGRLVRSSFMAGDLLKTNEKRGMDSQP